MFPVEIDAVRTLGTSGKTIASAVETQAMSRASLYRALAETKNAPRRDHDEETELSHRSRLLRACYRLPR